MDFNKITESPHKNYSPNKRRREDAISTLALKYFEFEKTLTDGHKNEKHYYKCQFCKELKNGTKNANLAGHLKTCNPFVFSEISRGENDPIDVKRLKLIQNLTEIVTVNGRPFTSLSDSGFMAILRKELDELRAAGCPLNLSEGNFPEIKDYLTNTAEKVRAKIKKEVKGKTLGLLCDIVTKNHRSLLGVSVQYMFDGQPRVRSIGIVELHQSHTGLYLAEKVIEILTEYDIETMQVISITTDNGSNVLKMVHDVEHLQAINQQKSHVEQNVAECDPPAEGESSADSSTLSDAEIAAVLAQPESVTDVDDAIDELFDSVESTANQNLLSDLCEEMRKKDVNALWDITGVNCVAHTLQLAIKDAMKKIAKKHKNVIELCRKVTKILRVKSTMNEANNAGVKYNWPHLENDTRWCSLFMMVCFRKTIYSTSVLFHIICKYQYHFFLF